MRFVKLTEIDAEDLYVRADHVCAVTPYKRDELIDGEFVTLTRSRIRLIDRNNYYVTDHPDAIIAALSEAAGGGE